MSSLESPTASLTTSTIVSRTTGSTPTSSPPSTSTPASVPLPTTTENHHDGGKPFPAMTTHWTPPLSCTWTYNVDNQPQPGATGAVAWLDLEPRGRASTLSCYPAGMFDYGRTGIFSPATCPNGWTTVSILVNTNEVKDKATTTAICCSSHYYLDGNHCKRSVPTVLAVPITYNKTASTYDILASTTTLYSATIAVYTIQALFQEDDKSMLGLQDEDDIDDENHSNPLSLNARIGIGVGAAIFTLLLIASITFLILRRRDRSQVKRSSHELHTVRARCRHSTGDRYMGHRTHRRTSHEGEPPPAYEVATDSNSVTATDSEGRGSTTSTTRDEEIRTLRVQKEAIQRRLEELERADTDRSRARTGDE